MSYLNANIPPIYCKIRKEYLYDLDPKYDKDSEEIMENAVTLAIPNKVDYESGDTWGDIYG